MRILYVTNGFPYPLTSGYLRHHFLIRELAADHEVVLVSLVGADHRPEHTQAMVAHTAEIHTVRTADRSGSRLDKLRQRLVAPGSGTVAGRDLGRVVADVVAAHPVEVAVVSGKRTHPVLDRLGGTPLVADLCDAASVRIRSEAEAATGLRRLRLAVRARETARAEKLLLDRAHHAVFASERDRRLLVDSLGRRPATSSIVANGVDAEYWRRQGRGRLGDTDVVFTGRMGYPPNADAAVVLVEDVMPRVWAEVPGARVRLVGRDPTDRVRALAGDDRVTVTGEVDDVRPYLEAAAVFAAPLRFATGIQNKLLEALAMEVPSVATTVAVAGLRRGGGEPPVVVADDPEHMARALVAHLRDTPAPGRRPDSEGRAFVVRHFSWQASGRDLLDAVDRAMTVAARPVGDRRRPGWARQRRKV